MPRGSAVEVGAASLLVPGHMRGDVQLACSRDEILGVVGLVRAHRDATLAVFLLLLNHRRAASRSAYPSACVTMAAAIRPLRFSPSVCPRYARCDSLP